MPSPEDCPDTFEQRVVSAFDVYVDAKIIQLERLKDFFRESMAIMGDAEEINARLAENGRPDLAINNRIDREELVYTRDLNKIWGNFTRCFDIITSCTRAGYEIYPIRITEEELDIMAATFPPIRSHEQLAKLRDSDQFPSLKFMSKHDSTTAFLRMLVLFPDFTKELVLNANSDDDRPENLGDLKFNFFIAEQLMSHLVDKQDYPALNDDGSVNSYFLHA